MGLLTKLLASAVTAMIASSGLARNYSDLVSEGYRWVKVNGPYACRTKEDLREVIGNPSEIEKLQMVEELRAVFLIEGALVKVIREDANAGVAQIRATFDFPGRTFRE